MVTHTKLTPVLAVAKVKLLLQKITLSAAVYQILSPPIACILI